MKNNYFAYLHSLWISQKKLFDIFSENIDGEEFFTRLSDTILQPYFANWEQRSKILEAKNRLDTKFINSIFERQQVKLISYFDTEYPYILKNIARPPFLLYIKWQIDTDPKIWVIGSRKMTQYGEKNIDTLIPSLSKYFTIVSWWAIGCDTKAHKSALESGGKTIVVVGTWIEQTYPSGNSKLYDNIVSSGWAILSIFPIGEWPQTYNFPIRNEIISWLSNGVLLVEAWEKSWTLITAQLALDQGRDLFAVPWDIYKTNSLGCNNLIKKGEAKMITGIHDILEEYNLSLRGEKKNEEKVFSSKQEQDIYNLLILETLTIDDIAKKLWLASHEIAVSLSSFEISWMVKKVQNWTYEVC